MTYIRDDNHHRFVGKRGGKFEFLIQGGMIGQEVDYLRSDTSTHFDEVWEVTNVRMSGAAIHFDLLKQHTDLDIVWS